MFGVNAAEALVIALCALIVIGPQRLPMYAERLGQLVREGRRMALGLREQVREEIGPEFDDVDWRQLDPRQYDPRRIVREALKDTFEDPSAAKAGTTPTRRPKPATRNAGQRPSTSADPAADETARETASETAEGTARGPAFGAGPRGTGTGTGTAGDPAPFDTEAT